MTRALLLATLSGSLHAAVIRGTVVENFTGKLLSRALVILQPLEGTPGDVRTMRSTRLGGFEFDGLAAGAYLVKASRRGFIPAEYGQKRWNSAGQPVVLEDSTTAFLPIRLPRFSAVSGTIVDENDIGLPDHEVSVYRASQPLELIRQVMTDDRGSYRIGNLEPGKYFVRTVGKQYDDGSYIPTFSKETLKVEQSQVADLYLEQQTDQIDIRPQQGRLWSLSVSVLPDPPGSEVTLTMASEMGRKTVKADSFRFTGLPPGDYEVYAEWVGGSSYQRLSVGRDETASLLPQPGNGVVVAGASAADSGTVWLRRKDLAGVGAAFALPLSGGHATVPAGRWEVMLEPASGYYVSGLFPTGNRRGRVDGWNEILTRPYNSFRFSLSGGPGALRGTVKDTPYAPVYLEPYDPATRQRVADVKATRADARGQYRFANLAPGTYRILSTYEYAFPNSETIDTASPLTVQLDAHTEVTKDLGLWVIR
jgi:hypothetical protein